VETTAWTTPPQQKLTVATKNAGVYTSEGHAGYLGYTGLWVAARDSRLV